MQNLDDLDMNEQQQQPHFLNAQQQQLNEQQAELLQHLQAQLIEAQIATQHANEAAATATLVAPPPPSTHSLERKINKPDVFNGKSVDVRTFISKCQLNFRASPLHFSTSDARITFAASYTGGDAYRWLEAYISQLVHAQPIWLMDWDAFAAKLIATFGDPDEEETATRKLMELTRLPVWQESRPSKTNWPSSTSPPISMPWKG